MAEIDLTDHVVEVRFAVRPVAAAMRRTAARLHAASVSFWPVGARRRHWRRCDVCNPAGNPPRLVVDGHAYRRRQLARRRRRR